MSENDSEQRPADGLFVHILGADECKPGEHHFEGWVEIDDGRGGTTVCSKCGLSAMSYSLRYGD